MKVMLTTAALLATTASATLPAAASPFHPGFGARGIAPQFGAFRRPIYGIIIRGVWVRPWQGAGPRGIGVNGPWGGIPGPRGVPVERQF